MTEAWIVVREERHIDDRFWVCLVKEDALKIAKDVVKYWKKEYGRAEGELDRTLYCPEARIFSCHAEDAFHVYVELVTVRGSGETDPEGF